MIKKVGACFLVLSLVFGMSFGQGHIAEAAPGFDTNMTGWKGIESSWKQTDDGFVDGEEQTVEDFAISDSTVDGTRDFIYTVELKKVSGYGAGLILGVKDSGSRQGILNNYIYFIADDANVYYKVTAGGVAADPVGRPLTDEEKSAPSLTFQVTYRAAEENAVFTLNGNVVQSCGSASRLSGKLGLMAHDAKIQVNKANLTLGDKAPEEGGDPLFETNLTGWKGIESDWKITPNGYRDGAEQSALDFAMSDVRMDGSKSFTYEVKLERISGYGFGLLFGVKNIDSRSDIQKEYSMFLVDMESVYCSIKGGDNLGRRLTEEEVCPRVADPAAEPRLYTMTMDYDAEDGSVTLYLDEEFVWTIYDEDLTGYLGLIAHEARVYVKSALLTVYEDTPVTPTGTEAPPVVTPTKAPAAETTAPSSESGQHAEDEGGFPVYGIVLIVAAVLAAAGAAVWFAVRKKKPK